MAWALRHSGQAVRSWYMAAFQVPVLPELVLRATLPLVLRGSGLPREDAERYAARFREPGAATGGLNWYRALTRASSQPGPGRPRHPGGRRITVPTTYVWGNGDPALGRAAAERTARYVAADYRFVELDAGHWLPETQPERVAEEVVRRAT
jgi:pimeloyl-ACP methyl ester carboxylesterase